ncbi:MAG TPA: polysaccharide deacetylase family protein [Puia sp.]|nr:polysaccharide deacetylase family protein [Puia sp.]
MKTALRSFSIWRRKTSYAWQDARSLLGLTADTFKAARGARIIVYHGICEHDHLRFNNIFLLRKTLEQHFRIFKKYFNVVSMDDYYRQRFDSRRLNICIHFDDGYANQLKYVLPLLEEYRLPASFFITAIRDAGYDLLWNDFLGLLNRYGPKELVFQNKLFRKQQSILPRYISSAGGIFPRYVSTAGRLGLRETLMPLGFGPKAALIDEFGHLLPRRNNEDFWLQMTTGQIRTLSRSAYVTIGAHGYYHNDLSKIPLADAEKEMLSCRRFLENITGKAIKALAFPYGTYTPALLEAAKRANFSQLLPLGIHHPDRILRERLIINPYVSVTNQLLNIIQKRYDFWR